MSKMTTKKNVISVADAGKTAYERFKIFMTFRFIDVVYYFNLKACCNLMKIPQNFFFNQEFSKTYLQTLY